MKTKLTLKLDKDLIEKAEAYAIANNTNLSFLIENYLRKITTDKNAKPKITPLVKSLSGIIKLPKTSARKGWEKSFKKMHSNGDDKLLIGNK